MDENSTLRDVVDRLQRELHSLQTKSSPSLPPYTSPRVDASDLGPLIYAYDIRLAEANDCIDRAERELKDLEQRLIDVVRENETVSQENARLLASSDSTDMKQTAASPSRSTDVDDTIASLQSEISSLNEENKTLHEQLQSVLSNEPNDDGDNDNVNADETYTLAITRLETSKAKLKKQFRMIKVENMNLRDRVSILEKDLEDSRKARLHEEEAKSHGVDALNATITSLSKELDASMKLCAALRVEVSDLKAKEARSVEQMNNDKQAQQHAHREEVMTIVQENQQLRMNVQQMTDRYNDLNSEHQRLRKTLMSASGQDDDSLRIETIELRNAKARLEIQYKELETKYALLNDTHAQYESQINALSVALSKATNEASNNRIAYLAARSSLDEIQHVNDMKLDELKREMGRQQLNEMLRAAETRIASQAEAIEILEHSKDEVVDKWKEHAMQSISLMHEMADADRMTDAERDALEHDAEALAIENEQLRQSLLQTESVMNEMKSNVIVLQQYNADLEIKLGQMADEITQVRHDKATTESTYESQVDALHQQLSDTVRIRDELKRTEIERDAQTRLLLDAKRVISTLIKKK